MNTIKKIAATALFVWGVVPLNAQQKRIYNSGIVVTQHALRQQGDSMLVDIELEARDLKLSSRAALTLTPALIGKETEQPLQSVLLNGRNRHKVYRRDLALHKIPSDTYYTAVKMTKKGKKVVRYRQTVPFAPWMSDARLAIGQELRGCGGLIQEADRTDLFAVTPVPVPVVVVKEEYQLQPKFSYVEPAVEPVKRRTELHDVYLSFPVNKVVIYPDYFNNATELTRAQQMVEKINTDKNLTIQEVVVRGYASPEGSVPSNYRLSEGRAAALKNYLAPRIEGDPLPMRAESGGEDWDGVIRLLELSDAPGRDTLLAAIRNCNRSDAAEQALRLIDGGAPYNLMLKEIYPKVRRVLCSVNYTAREFTVAESREMIGRNPEQLSLYEIVQLANSYPEGSPEFFETLATAVRIYPNDPTALLNAATASLAQGDLAQGEAYLKRIEAPSQALYNTWGVLEMLKGDRQAAEIHLKKALGSAAAQHNLDELAKKYGTTNESNR